MSNSNANLVLTTGSFVDRSRIIGQIKKAVGDHDLFTFDKDDLVSQVDQQICEYSCFGNKKIVILNAWPRAGKKKPDHLVVLKNTLKNLSDDCVVILNNLKPDKTLADYIKKQGKAFNYDDPLKFHNAVVRAGEYVQEKN